MMIGLSNRLERDHSTEEPWELRPQGFPGGSAMVQFEAFSTRRASVSGRAAVRKMSSGTSGTGEGWLSNRTGSTSMSATAKAARGAECKS
jgi:hypothetical protein